MEGLELKVPLSLLRGLKVCVLCGVLCVCYVVCYVCVMLRGLKVWV